MGAVGGEEVGDAGHVVARIGTRGDEADVMGADWGDRGSSKGGSKDRLDYEMKGDASRRRESRLTRVNIKICN